jgi:UDP-N-acetylglucosamine 2-epimerase (non-hydrolysing)
MLRQCLEIFDIVPDIDLAVMQPNQDLSSLTARMLSLLPQVFSRVRPDAVLVQGDTTTAFASALAAFYSRIPVGHVEAGLRTYNLKSPFPEEAMRQMISRIASWHFAPTQRNAEALCREGITQEHIAVTGNTVIDSLLDMSKIVRIGLRREHLQLSGELEARLSQDCKLVLITGHRRESFGAGLENICHAIRDLASQFPEVLFIYPVHLNPNVHEPVCRMLGHIRNVVIIDPVNYYTFVYLMNRSYLIISDSGGVQEEAPSLHRPVFVTRNNSERMEAVSAGAVRLVGTSRDVIVREVAAALSDGSVYQSMVVEENPYGDGNAADRILQFLLKVKTTQAERD